MTPEQHKAIRLEAEEMYPIGAGSTRHSSIDGYLEGAAAVIANPSRYGIRVAPNEDAKEFFEQLSPKLYGLANCPHCNGEEGVDVFIGHASPHHFRIACIPCSVEIKHDRKDKVIFHWNQRVGIGPVWVKCSERLPTKNHCYHTKVKAFNGDIYNLATPWHSDWGWANKTDVIEWLDETGLEMSNEKVLEILHAKEKELQDSLLLYKNMIAEVIKRDVEITRLTDLDNNVHLMAKKGIIPNLPVYVQGSEMCVEIDNAITEALKTSKP